jgi:hypothetical protein
MTDPTSPETARAAGVPCNAGSGSLLAGEERADLQDQFRRHRHRRKELSCPS